MNEARRSFQQQDLALLPEMIWETISVTVRGYFRTRIKMAHSGG
jgi:hypothetical protein